MALMLGTADCPACTYMYLSRNPNLAASCYTPVLSTGHYHITLTLNSKSHEPCFPVFRAKRQLFRALATTPIDFTDVRRLRRTIMGAARAQNPGSLPLLSQLQPSQKSTRALRNRAFNLMV